MGNIQAIKQKGNLVELVCDGRVINLNIAEIVKEDEQFASDARLFNVNYQNLCERFPDEWIAIYKGEIAGHNKDFRELLRELSARGITGEYMDRTYVNERPEIFIGAAA